MESNWDPVLLDLSRPLGFIPLTVRLNNDRSSFLDVLNPQAYQEFIDSVIISKTVPVYVEGSASARVQTGMGDDLIISDVAFQQEIEIDGLDEFKDIDIRFLDNLDVKKIGAGTSLEFRLVNAWMKLPAKGKLGIDGILFNYF